MKDLNNLPEVLLETKTNMRMVGNRVVLDMIIKNPTPNIALMAHLQLQGKKSKKRILPAFYSDNYVSLVPNETKRIAIECRKEDLKGDSPVIKVDGWNVKVKESLYVSQNKNADVNNEKWGKNGFGFIAREPVRKDAVRINCGGYNRGNFEKDPGGMEIWMGYSTQDMKTYGLKNPAPKDVYRTVRWADCSYNAYLSGKPGSLYTVRLHFVDQGEDRKPNQRAFNVKINGKEVLKDYDVVKEAGMPCKAVIEEFKDIPSDAEGKINIFLYGGAPRFDGDKRDPQIAGIEVLPQ